MENEINAWKHIIKLLRSDEHILAALALKDRAEKLGQDMTDGEVNYAIKELATAVNSI